MGKRSSSLYVGLLPGGGSLPWVAACDRPMFINRDIKIGSIYDGGFVEQWFSDQHVQAWKDFRIDDCSNPCKFYRYKEVVDAAMQGLGIELPPSNQIVHRNFV